MYGNDYEYANSRLAGTIVREAASGEPISVRRVLDSGEVDFTYLKGGRAKLHLNEINVEPVSLGYSYVEGQLTYVMRMPVREDWRQGLRPHNSYTTRGFPSSSELRKTIMGKYFKFGKAVARAYAGVDAAFHRHWAIKSDKNLYYLDKAVGKLIEKGQVVLDDKYQFLQEALDRAID